MSNDLITYQTIFQTNCFLTSKYCDICLNNDLKSSCVFFIKDDLLNNAEKTIIETRVSILNCQIPLSMYIINETNNKFYVNDTPRYFEHGNYNIDSFIQELQNMLEFITVIYDSIKNKIIIQSTQNIVLSDNAHSIFPLIGFKQGVVYTSTYIDDLNGSYYELKAPFQINLSGLQNIYIHSPSFDTKNVDSYSKGKNCILSNIPVDAEYGSILYYTNNSNQKNIFKTISGVSSIQIDLMDDNYNFLNLHNQDFSISLVIETVIEYEYDKKTFDEIYQINE